MKKRLLLHICCAPDATVGIERLSGEFLLEGYFYNPNIHPEEEYRRRLKAVEALSSLLRVPWREGDYDPEGWRHAVRGLEDEPEKGRRCEICIAHRLDAAARTAREGGFDAFAAVLTVSPHKDAGMVNRLGDEAGRRHGVHYVPTDLKKRGGFNRSVALSRQWGLYRQNYCGCVFSMRRGKKA